MISQVEYDSLKEELASYKGKLEADIETSDLIEKELEANVQRLEEHEIELEEELLKKEDALVEARKLNQTLEREAERNQRLIEELRTVITVKDKKIRALENIVDDLENKHRFAQSSLETAQYDLDKTNEELILIKSLGTPDMSPMGRFRDPTDSPTMKHADAQTDHIEMPMPVMKSVASSGSINAQNRTLHIKEIQRTSFEFKPIGNFKFISPTKKFAPSRIGLISPESFVRNRNDVLSSVKNSMLGGKENPTPLKNFLNENESILKHFKNFIGPNSTHKKDNIILRDSIRSGNRGSEHVVKHSSPAVQHRTAEGLRSGMFSSPKFAAELLNLRARSRNYNRRDADTKTSLERRKLDLGAPDSEIGTFSHIFRSQDYTSYPSNHHHPSMDISSKIKTTTPKPLSSNTRLNVSELDKGPMYKDIYSVLKHRQDKKG